MVLYHVIFLALLFVTEGFFLFLDVINIRHAEEYIDQKQQWLRDEFGVDDTGRLKHYLRLKSGFSRLVSIIGLGFLILVLYTNAFQSVVSLFEGLPVSPLTQGVIFFVSLAVLMVILSWPTSLFKSFVIEEIFDFNNLTLKIWLKDQLKSIGITIIFSGLLSGALLWFITRFPQTWWLWGWAMFVGFGLLMQVIYPRLIAPLFNDFEPVEEGELHQAVKDVFDRAGFTCSEIFTMDASRRSGHSNAYFIGFGRTKRVVLFDTLIDQLELSEVQGVLAHELAHWKKGHVWKGVFRSAVQTGIMLGLLYFLVESSWVYKMFGVTSSLKYVGLLLGGLWLAPLGQWLAPLDNYFSIRDEREADEFAVEVMSEGSPLIDALCGLVSENLGNPFPHPMYASFHYSHPPIPDRIEYIRNVESNISSGTNSPTSSSRE